MRQTAAPAAKGLGLRPALALFLGGLIVLYPLFFVVFRLTVFKTVPFDDYAPYLLWVVHDREGAFPESPYCYRILSVLAAVPFYYGLPPLSLTNIPAALAPSWIKATAAISALSFVGMVASMVAVAALGIRRHGLTLRDGLLAGLLLLLLGFYTEITAIDAVALFGIAFAVLVIDRKWAFAAAIFVSIGVDEKIALVLALWLTIRCLLVPEDRAWLLTPWVLSVAAVGAYVGLVLLLHLPGNEYQLRPAGFVDTVRENLHAYVSMRGLLLNVLPALALLAIGGLAHRRPAGDAKPLFRRVDLLIIPAMLIVALVLTHLFQAGRLAMHAAPLFVVPFVASLGPEPRRVPARQDALAA